MAADLARRANPPDYGAPIRPAQKSGTTDQTEETTMNSQQQAGPEPMPHEPAANSADHPDGRPAVHPVDQRLPVRQLASFGLQHVLVMYAGAVAVPLILGSALGLTQQQMVTLINANLLTSGIATLIQTLGF